MDWDKLKIFYAVAESGNFTKATYALNLSQSAISRQIQSLEQELKTQLFERHARGLSLTENGEYLFKTAREVISKLKDVESTLMDRKEFEGEPKILGKGLWDGVVDTVGGVILSNVISQTKPSGIVAACGNAANIKLNTTVMPFIIRGVKLWGIDSVMISKKRREFVWSQVPGLIDFKFLEKHTKTVNLEELLIIFPSILKGEIAGRVLVDLNK